MTAESAESPAPAAPLPAARASTAHPDPKSTVPPKRARAKSPPKSPPPVPKKKSPKRARAKSTRSFPVFWETFITAYIKNGENGAAAWRHAFPYAAPSTCKSGASRLFLDDNFLQLLSISQDEMRKRASMERAEFVDRLVDIAKFDLRRFLRVRENGDLALADDWRARRDGHALEALEVNTETESDSSHASAGGEDGPSRTHVTADQKFRLKAVNKLKAFEILGKVLGYTTEKVDVTSGGKPLAPSLVVGLPPKRKS